MEYNDRKGQPSKNNSLLLKILKADYPQGTLQIVKMITEQNSDAAKDLFGDLLIEAKQHMSDAELEEAIRKVSIAQQFAETFDNRELAIICFHMKAQILVTDSKFDDSLVEWEKALDLSLKTGNKLAASLYLGVMADIYNIQGDFDRSLEYLERARFLHSEAEKEPFGTMDKIHKPLSPLFQTAIYGDMGVTYQEIQDTDRALEFYKKSLNLCKDIGNSWGVAVNLQNLGTIYKERKERQKSLEHFHKALAICIMLDRKKSQVNTLINLAGLYRDIDSFPKSFDCGKRALRISRQIGKKELEAHALHSLASLYLDYGSPEKAIEYLSEAISLIEEYGHKILLFLFWQRGLAHERHRDLKNAFRDYKRAIGILEDARGMLFLEEHKISYIKDKISIYEKMIFFCQKNNWISEAFNYIERAKSRIFLELMTTTYISPPLELEEENRDLLEQEEECLSKIKNLNIRQYQYPDEPMYEIGKQLRETEERLKKIYKRMANISKAAGEYVSLRGGQPLNFENVKECLR